MLPICGSVLGFWFSYLSLKGKEETLLQLKIKAIPYQIEEANIRSFLEQEKRKHPRFLEKFSSLSLLKKEKGWLESLSFKGVAKQRLKELEKNRLIFKEKDKKKVGDFQLVTYETKKEVEVDVEDLLMILGSVEGVKVEGVEPLVGRPDLWFQKLYIKKEVGGMGEHYRLGLELVERKVLK